MKYALQVMITTDESQTETREIACLEREDLVPTTWGLTLAEDKAILKARQEVVVERQMTAYLDTQRPCPHCGAPRHSKGSHPMQSRTVFGTIPVKSPACISAPVNPLRPRRAAPSPPCSQTISRRSCSFWRRSGRQWCRMASPPSSCTRCCRSMTRSPPARFESMSSPALNAWSKPWGRSSGRSSIAVQRNGATCPSPMAH
jgi:hypothetical protein